MAPQVPASMKRIQQVMKVGGWEPLCSQTVGQGIGQCQNKYIVVYSICFVNEVLYISTRGGRTIIPTCQTMGYCLGVVITKQSHVKYHSFVSYQIYKQQVRLFQTLWQPGNNNYDDGHIKEMTLVYHLTILVSFSNPDTAPVQVQI